MHPNLNLLLSRRRFLQTALAAGTASLFPGCGGGSNSPINSTQVITPLGGGRGVIAYTAPSDPNIPDRHYVFTARIDGTQIKQVTPTSTTTYLNYASPMISPDATRIAVNQTNASGNELTVMNWDGSGAKILTACQGLAHIQWTPDGTALVFENTMGGIDFIKADGTGQVTLIATGVQPAVNPVTGELAFSTNGQIYRTNPLAKTSASSSVKALKNGGEPQYYPSWSPDGTRLAYVRRVTGVIIAADTETDIFTLGAQYAPLVFSPNGQQYCVVNPYNTNPLVITNLPLTRGSTTITAIPNFFELDWK